MAQAKMQAYMDRHKLGPLFEDLMNRVLRDMPEEPLVYLLRTLYKKAGMEIPQDIRYGGLRKSVDLARSRSPERVNKSTDPNAVSVSRDYGKPWLTHQRRMKPRHSAEDMTGKKKMDWSGDTKILARSFDDLWEEGQARDPSASLPGKKPRPKNDPRSSWAAVGLDSGDTFINGEYHGPSQQAQGSEEELLAAEMLRPFAREADSSPESAPVLTASRVRGQRVDSERHRQKLETILYSEGTAPHPTAPTKDSDSDDKDSALEMLENAEDLEREGVKNIPSSGYTLSKILRERKNENFVKLNINPQVHGSVYKWASSMWSDKDSVQSYEGYESDRENVSPAGQWTEEDEEFESVSQVTGPRKPVWNLPDSDVESAAPHRSQKHRRTQQRDKQDLAASAPNVLQQVSLTAGDLDPPVNQTWSPGLNVPEEDSGTDLEQKTDMASARSGGWLLPDDSDAASALDWNQRVKGEKRDPRSY